MTVILFLFCVIVALTLVSGAYVFVVACLRRKDLPWLVEEEIAKTPYAKYTEIIFESDKWLKDHNAQSVYISGYDGVKLHGLWIPVENPRGTVLFAHGYRSTMLVDFGMAFDYYHNQGLNILVPEQRAHGKSQGRFITFGVKESRDMQCWIDFHNERLGTFPMILSGMSMGASTMMYLADKDLPDNIRGLIVDCGFSSPKEILSSVFRNVTHLPAIPTLWATDFFARIFAGFSIYACDSKTILRNSRFPILMVHGTDDSFVPCKMTKQAHEVCTSPKELLLVEGAEHGLSFPVDRERYIAAISNFLNKYLFDSISP